MLTLHYAPDTASLVLRLALGEIGRPCRTVPVDRAAREPCGPTFRRLNPQGLFPVLDPPEGPLFETGATLLWLADRHGTLAPPVARPDRSHFLKWLFFVSNTLHADRRQVIHSLRHTPATCRDGHHALATARLREHFDRLDSRAAAEQGWVATRNPAALDLYVAVTTRGAALYTAGQPRWFDATRVPALHDLACRLDDRPATRRAAHAEGLGPTPFSAPVFAGTPADPAS